MMVRRSDPLLPVLPLPLLLRVLLISLISTSAALPEQVDDPDECRSSDGDYRGSLNVAYDGTECMPWIEQPNFYRTAWSDARAMMERNFCRNPDKDVHGPWCAVQRSAFKYCNVPRCAQEVGCYEGDGTDYSGEQDRTVDGVPCKAWSHTSAVRTWLKRVRFRLHQNESHSTTLRTTDDRLQSFTACRNPGGAKSRPWCYAVSTTSAAKGDKSYCDIPKCSDQSNLGYPLYGNDSDCARGFIRQTQTTGGSETGERSFDYCIAPYRLLHRIHRRTHYENFTDFCLFLVGGGTHCPAGFRKSTRYLPNPYRITHVSGPTACRAATENLLHCIQCCSDPRYFKNHTVKPYIMMEKITRYKLVERSSTKDSSLGRMGHWDSEDLEQDSNGSGELPDVTDIVGTFNDEAPRFASVRRCPPVDGMTRLVYLNLRYLFDSETPVNQVQTASDDILCEYHQLVSTDQAEPTTGNQNTVRRTVDRLALIVREPVCPHGYRKLHIPRTILFLLGTSSSLCELTDTDSLAPSNASDAYCLPVVSTEDVTDTTETGWGKPSNITCPEGFRPNEVHFIAPEYRLKLCCSYAATNNESSTSQNIRNIQVPSGFNLPFSVIQLGPYCPKFHAGSMKLNAISYIQQIPSESVKKLELIGPDEPVRPSVSIGISVCQYLRPDAKLGVKSLTFDCEGLGHRAKMTFSGVTCGFDIAEDAIFPAGKYCFLQIHSDCPPGFTSQAGMMRLQALDNMCCRTEESIGAIRFPVKLSAPFKLPALHQPCQAVEGFNMDAELDFCVYYPQGSTPQTLLVEPRVVRAESTDPRASNNTVSIPEHCAIMPRKRKKIQRSQLGRLTTLFFNFMQDQWLIQKRPRWKSRVVESGDVCFLELHHASLPAATESGGGRGYCVFSFATCPGENFELLGSSLYMNTVLCCTRLRGTSSSQTSPTSTAARPLHALVTLGHVTEADKQFLRRNLGATVLPNTTSTDGDTGCPQLDGAGLKLTRRVAHSNLIPDALPIRVLFNLSAVVSEQQFLERTGIWEADNMVHVIYCEYTSKHKGRVDKSKKEWPLANFAIPKSMVPCPNHSETVLISHNQHHHGFHYSRPIHLDGMYLQGEKNAVLAYCVFTSESERRSVYDEDVRGELPAGHYCVLQVHDSCPVGFESGLLSVVEGQDSPLTSTTTQDSTKDFTYNSGTHATPLNIDRVHIQPSDSVKISRLDYRFCCRADSISVDNPIQGFPTDTGPFYLYRVGDKCQSVEGMRVSDEHICMDAPNKAEVDWRSLEQNYSWVPYTITGLTPARIPFHTSCDVEINLCYYEPDISHPTKLSYEIHNTGDWPQGEYALPNVHRSDPQVACPPGFTQQHLSLLHRIPFLEIDIIPPTMGPYFLELLGHNLSAFNVHYCVRDPPESTGERNKTYDEQAAQWPRGDYCVIATSPTNSCPPGLHRHTRSIAELCCRNDNLENPPEVEWPFVEDFFMFGVPRCLPVKDTYVERYLVRLVPFSEAKIGKDWDVMCHYLPLTWISNTSSWPPGDYMLPIGHRGGLRTAMINTVEYTDRLTPDHLPSFINNHNHNNTSHPGNVSSEESGERPHYKCPESFQRARFTFVSKSSERQRSRPRADGARLEDMQVVSTTAMEFCIRENDTDDAEAPAVWPAGDYCVFTMNADCPVEMQASESMPLVIPRFVLKSVDLLDEYGERIENRHWHEDVEMHVVHFMQCCRTDRNLLLRLPVSEDGFYLKSSNGLCSRVPGTVLDREKVTSYLASPLTHAPMSEEPSVMIYRDLIAQQAGVMYLCYYHPVDQLDRAFALAAEQLATTFNVTERDLVKIASMCGCAENAFCLPHKGAECVCNLGYFGDGRHLCRPITPLTDECANMCDPAATCSEPLDGVFRRKKEVQLWSHACICRPGYVGDGFTCQPSCAAHVCQQFSRCIHNVVKNTISCECIEGTVQSEGRCNLDMYKSIQHEKDLPQFLVHYDHCLSEETQNALRLLQPSRYFYLFVPRELIKNCQDMAAHLVVMKQKLTERQIQAATALNPIRLITENNTVIEIYAENGTWSIDGQPAKRNPILFVNGELYLLTASLKRTPNQPSAVGYYVAAALVSILLLALIAGVIYLAVVRPDRVRSTFVPLRNRLLSRRRRWHNSGGSVLIEYTEGNEAEQEE